MAPSLGAVPDATVHTSAIARMARFMRHEAWDDALFVHYPVDADALQKLLPPGLLVDAFEGVAYIGIVCLSERGIVPWPAGIPLWLVRCLGLSHHAVNVRTYVRTAHGPPGIFFFTLECSAALPAVGARLLFNLPYCLARMRRGAAARGGVHSPGRVHAPAGGPSELVCR